MMKKMMTTMKMVTYLNLILKSMKISVALEKFCLNYFGILLIKALVELVIKCALCLLFIICVLCICVYCQLVSVNFLIFHLYVIWLIRMICGRNNFKTKNLMIHIKLCLYIELIPTTEL